MMKGNDSIFAGWQAVIIAFVVVLCGLLEPAYCQGDNPALLLQQTPPQGGTITPDVGVHHFERDADVTLAAVPKPGYQFVYWLGDVSDPAASSTIVYLDAPKIVIAVFEQIEFEFLVMEGGPQIGFGGGALFISAAEFGSQGFGGPGGKRPPKPPIEEPEQEDFPVPIPEPATGVLLGLGSLFVFARRRAKR